MLEPRRVIFALFAVNVFLAAAYLVTSAGWIRSYTLSTVFDMDGENTICSWYSSALLTGSAICWFLRMRTQKGSGSSTWDGAMTLLLGLLSLDETASLHESFASTVKSMAQTSLSVTGPAVLLSIPAAAVCYLLSRRWPKPSPPALFFWGLCLLPLSAGVPELVTNFLSWGSPAYILEVAMEETGEMTAMTAILLGSYDHMAAERRRAL